MRSRVVKKGMLGGKCMSEGMQIFFIVTEVKSKVSGKISSALALPILDSQ